MNLGVRFLVKLDKIQPGCARQPATLAMPIGKEEFVC